MFTILQTFHFCYGHRLLDHPGKCAHPHGHNARVEVEIGSRELNSQGMVIDFNDIKSEIKTFLDELDHKMILRKDDVLTKVLQDMGEPVFVMEESPTAENLARLVYQYAKSRGLSVTSVKLWETPSSYAEYRE